MLFGRFGACTFGTDSRPHRRRDASIGRPLLVQPTSRAVSKLALSNGATASAFIGCAFAGATRNAAEATANIQTTMILVSFMGFSGPCETCAKPRSVVLQIQARHGGTHPGPSASALLRAST